MFFLSCGIHARWGGLENLHWIPGGIRRGELTQKHTKISRERAILLLYSSIPFLYSNKLIDTNASPYSKVTYIHDAKSTPTLYQVCKDCGYQRLLLRRLHVWQQYMLADGSNRRGEGWTFLSVGNPTNFCRPSDVLVRRKSGSPCCHNGTRAIRRFILVEFRVYLSMFHVAIYLLSVHFNLLNRSASRIRRVATCHRSRC